MEKIKVSTAYGLPLNDAGHYVQREFDLHRLSPGERRHLDFEARKLIRKKFGFHVSDTDIEDVRVVEVIDQFFVQLRKIQDVKFECHGIEYRMCLSVQDWYYYLFAVDENGFIRRLGGVFA